ncbi:hypothetical protein CHS0354_005747, partial [Potamilus streckersoni]
TSPLQLYQQRAQMLVKAEVDEILNKLNKRERSTTGDPQKAGDGGCTALLTKDICSVFETGDIPNDWKQSIILTFHKDKDSKWLCSYCCSITMVFVRPNGEKHPPLQSPNQRLFRLRGREQSDSTPGRSIDSICYTH